MISYPQWVAPQAIDFTGNFGRGFQIGQGIRQDQRNSAGLDVLRNLNPMAPQSQQPQGGALSQIGMLYAPPNAPTSADPQTAMVNASHAAAANAVDPALEGYFANARRAESGGNDLAKNPKSSATGRYQFLEGTWRDLMRQYPELGLTADGRTDPAQQERAMARFTQDNARTLASRGLPVNPGTLYAAHFLGPAGASAVLGQDPNSALSAYLQPGVLEANPHLNGMSVGDFVNWANSKGGNGSGGYSGPSSALDAANSLAANGLPDVGAGQGQPFSLSGDQLADLMGSDMTRGFAQSYLQAEQERQASQGRFVVEQGPNGSVWQRDRLTGQTNVLMTPQQTGAVSSSSYSQTPVFLRDPQGNQHIAQVSSSGGLLVNGQVMDGLPEGWTVTNRPQGMSIQEDGSQQYVFDPNTGTMTPVGALQGSPGTNMNVEIGPNGERVMTPAPGSSEAEERSAAASARESAARQADDRAAYVLNSIDTALGKSGFFTTGPLGSIGRATGLNTTAVELEQAIATVQANLGFNELQQMREASPTGGALGQVTERELALLQSTVTSLDPRQGEEQLRINLQTVANLLQRQRIYREIDRRGLDVNSQEAQAMLSQYPLPGQRPSGLGQQTPASIANDAEYEALPSRTRFVGPDGQERIKP